MSEESTTDCTCAICMEDIEDSSHAHRLEGCSHTFHANCIIQWMRRGNLSCPSCRHNLHQQVASEHMPPRALFARAQYLRRTVGRRKTAPSELKRLLEELRKAELKERAYTKELNDLKRVHKEALTAISRLRYRRRIAWLRTRDLTRVLGLFSTPDLELPPLVLETY